MQWRGLSKLHCVLQVTDRLRYLCSALITDGVIEKWYPTRDTLMKDLKLGGISWALLQNAEHLLISLRIKTAHSFALLRSAECLQVVLTYILKLITTSQCQATIVFTSVFFNWQINLWRRILVKSNSENQEYLFWLRLCLQHQMTTSKKLHIGIILTRAPESIAGQKQLRKQELVRGKKT